MILQLFKSDNVLEGESINALTVEKKLQSVVEKKLLVALPAKVERG